MIKFTVELTVSQVVTIAYLTVYLVGALGT